MCIARAIPKTVGTAARTTISHTLGGVEVAEWCNSFMIVPKLNDTIYLCLDPTRLVQAVIKLVHRGPISNDMLPARSVNIISYMYTVSCTE